MNRKLVLDDLPMPLDERKDRWHAMMAALRANSVHDWASHFLQALANEAESGEFDRVHS